MLHLKKAASTSMGGSFFLVIPLMETVLSSEYTSRIITSIMPGLGIRSGTGLMQMKIAGVIKIYFITILMVCFTAFVVGVRLILLILMDLLLR
jgi:hypothetical protein